jgi:galactoside O-acetyltransferase
MPCVVGAGMNTDAFFNADELREAGFVSVGANTRVSRKVSLYAISGRMGDNVRIDDFSVLKGRIDIGSHVHIASFCSVSGTRGEVRLENCSTLSNGVCIYTGSDDYRATALSSSTVPEEFLATITGDVTVQTATLIGTHTVILPGAEIGEGASVGALCIVRGVVPRGAIIVANGSSFRIKSYRDADTIIALARRLMKTQAIAG